MVLIFCGWGAVGGVGVRGVGGRRGGVGGWVGCGGWVGGLGCDRGGADCVRVGVCAICATRGGGCVGVEERGGGV